MRKIEEKGNRDKEFVVEVWLKSKLKVINLLWN